MTKKLKENYCQKFMAREAITTNYAIY